MNKKKGITIILSIILVAAAIKIILPYFTDKTSLKPSSTSVNDLDTNVKLDTSDEKIEWSNYANREITLTKSITITEAGVYNLYGKIEDGLITIKTDGDIKLTLDNVSISNSNGPAIYVENANTVVISTVKDSINTLADGSNYLGYDEDIEGAIYSKDDLKINSGTYKIISADDGIRGKDSVYILDGTFNIDALGDGIKSTNDTDTTKGYIKIENGTFNITATLDGIQAQTKVLISNGVFNITTGGGCSNSSDKSSWENWGSSSTTSDSAKGIKAVDNIILTNGTYNFNTSDDSIHSNNYVGISGGTYRISSGDDGIHADLELVIDNGQIDIQKSYEGLEAEKITINNGNIKVVSSDDGLNAAGGNDSSAMNRPGASPNTSTEKSTLTINDGTIYIDASGDRLDANGSIHITGGSIVVEGPTNSGNGALDYDSECKITGGSLIAIGASGMAQGISASSTQYGVLINFTSNYSSGTKATIVDSNNNEIISYTSTKSFSSIVFSSNKLSTGTYTVKINGNTYQTFTINNISTTVGNASGMGGGNRGGRR